MKKVFTSLFFLFILFVSCSMPKADDTIAMMNRYWNFYRVENFDSLKTFYTGSIPDTSFWNALRGEAAQYGDIKDINLSTISVGQSFSEGENIELTYQVVYDKNFLYHKFTFKKNDKGVFKIVRHELTK
jgi:hypothetical protein